MVVGKRALTKLQRTWVTSETFGCFCINANLQIAGNDIKWGWIAFSFVEVEGCVNWWEKRRDKMAAETPIEHYSFSRGTE